MFGFLLQESVFGVYMVRRVIISLTLVCDWNRTEYLKCETVGSITEGEGNYIQLMGFEVTFEFRTPLFSVFTYIGHAIQSVFASYV